MNVSGGSYRASARVMLAISLAAGIGALIVIAFVPPHAHPDGANWKSVSQIALWELTMLTASVLGVLVARRGRNPIGWVFAIGGLLGSLAVFGDEWGAYAISHDAPGAVAGVFTSSVGLFLSWGILGVFVPLLFPDGRLRSRRWRPVAWLGAVSALAYSMEIFRPTIFDKKNFDIAGLVNPIAIKGADSTLNSVAGFGLLGLFAAMFVAVGALIGRFFRSKGDERQQLKVIAYTAVVVLVGSIVAANLDGALKGTVFDPVVHVVQAVLIAAIPAAFGVAILRYRLYDIDVVIRKTLVYGLMAAFISVIYVGIVVGVGAAVGSGDHPNLGLSILATAIVAVLFQPVREHVQRFANRLVYGVRATPYEVMTAFSKRIGQELSVEQVLPGIAETAARGVAGEASRVDVFLEDGHVRSASWPADASPPKHYDIIIDVAHQGETVGRLSIAKANNDLLRPAEKRLLNDLASHAGIALHNVRLAEQLHAQLDQISAQAVELRRSRQRIVEAQDSERKRIERDLHDGAQQQLVALAMTLRMTANRLGEGANPEVAELLQRAISELRTAHRDLRDLARGIHPAILTDAGLVPAIQTIAERAPMPVRLEVCEGRFPLAVEATAFFVVSEALTNVAKYARASSAAVRIAQRDSMLEIEVSDDGVGGADPSRGSGLRGLRDRVAALDGTIVVDSEQGKGTRIMVELTCV